MQSRGRILFVSRLTGTLDNAVMTLKQNEHDETTSISKLERTTNNDHASNEFAEMNSPNEISYCGVIRLTGIRILAQGLKEEPNI